MRWYLPLLGAALSLQTSLAWARRALIPSFLPPLRSCWPSSKPS